jgi:hypothetical protein
VVFQYKVMDKLVQKQAEGSNRRYAREF